MANIQNKIARSHKQAVNDLLQYIERDVLEFVKEYGAHPSLKEYLLNKKPLLLAQWEETWKYHLLSSISVPQRLRMLQSEGVNTRDISSKVLNRKFVNIATSQYPFSLKKQLKGKYHTPKLWYDMINKAKRQFNKQCFNDEQMEVLGTIVVPVFNGLMVEKVSFFSKQYLTYISGYLKGFVRQYHLQEEKESTLLQLYKTHNVKNFSLQRTLNLLSYDFIKLSMVPFIEKELTKRIDTSTAIFPKNRKVSKREFLLMIFGEELQGILEIFLSNIEDESIGAIIENTDILTDVHQSTMQKQVHQFLEVEKSIFASIYEEQAEFREKMNYIFENDMGGVLPSNTKYHLYIGPTNSGKTYQALERMKQCTSGVYLGPLRMLALEVYDTLNKAGVPCHLRTGEEERLTENACHTAGTVEMFQDRDRSDIIVIDEAQMIADKERGFSWYKSITRAQAKEVHIIGSESSRQLLTKLLQGADVTVHNHERKTALTVVQEPFRIRNVQKGDALVVFSRKRVLELASRLERDGHRVAVIYGNMPPASRQAQVEQFISGERSVLVATDAIAMGLNLPIRRVILMESEKFDGAQMRPLTSQEVKQIAGRAGRMGIYDEGFVQFAKNANYMERLLLEPDEPITQLTIAPTRQTLERFYEYERNLSVFFDLWKKFKTPAGVIKANLAQEEMLYHTIKKTFIPQRIDKFELYEYLQMPFSAYDSRLALQWKESLFKVILGETLDEPKLRNDTLEDLEHSYKSIELHLMFLYRLNKKTEAYYWEIVKNETAESINTWLDTNIEKQEKKCHRCSRPLTWDYPHNICQSCFEDNYSYRRNGF